MILDAHSPAPAAARPAGRHRDDEDAALAAPPCVPGAGAHTIPSFFKSPAPPTDTTLPYPSSLAPVAAASLLTAPALEKLFEVVRARAAAVDALSSDEDGDDNGDGESDGGGDDALAEGVLDYEAYRQAAADAATAAGPAAARLLSARAFLRLATAAAAASGDDHPPPPPGTVPVAALCAYLGQRAGQLQMHAHLCCFASRPPCPADADAAAPSSSSAPSPDAWLDAGAVVAFVADTLPQLASSGCGVAFPGALPPAQHAALAARKLTFFHGARPGGRPVAGRVRVRDLLAGAPLAELLDLHRPPPPPPAASAGDGGSPLHHPGGPLDNWFSAASAARVAALFADLAEQKPDGSSSPHPPSISAAGLGRLNGGTLSPLFAARLVEERGSAPGGGLSLDDFVSFLLAWADRGAPASLRWLFPALDVRGAGALTRCDVHTLFDAVRALWVERGQYPELRTADVVAEVFDMVAPADPAVLTLADLIRCGRGGGGPPPPPSAASGCWGAGTGGTVAGAVVGLLADVSCFWEHDSREAALQAAALQAQQQQQAAAQQAVQQQLQPVQEASGGGGGGGARWEDVDPGWGGGEVGGRPESLRERAVRRAAASAAASAAAASGDAAPASPPGPAPAPPACWAFSSPTPSEGSEAWSDGFAVAGDETPPRGGGGAAAPAG